MSLVSRQKEKIHSWTLFLITLFALLFILLNLNLWCSLLVAIVVFVFYFKAGLSLKSFFKYLFIAISFSFVFFLMSLLYGKESLKTNELIFNLDRGIVLFAFKNWMRLILLSSLSMASSSVINYTVLLLYRMKYKSLSVFAGYPLLLAMNSVSLFKDEFVRIRLAAKLRGLGSRHQFLVLFPLLVFAIRHSHRGSLSLVSRGLNEKKTFYFDYAQKPSDHLIFWGFLGFLILMVAIAIYFR